MATGYLGRGYKLRGQHVDSFSHCSIWLCYTASDLALAHKKTKFESSINSTSDKMPSFLWQGNLPNRASKIKRLLARHDIHLPRASGKVLSYTSDTRTWKTRTWKTRTWKTRTWKTRTWKTRT